jgi:hypothetical protein
MDFDLEALLSRMLTTHQLASPIALTIMILIILLYSMLTNHRLMLVLPIMPTNFLLVYLCLRFVRKFMHLCVGQIFMAFMWMPITIFFYCNISIKFNGYVTWGVAHLELCINCYLGCQVYVSIRLSLAD